MRNATRTLLLAIMLFQAFLALNAQSTKVELSGVVMDPGGLAVPDVVPLLNGDTRSLYPYDRLNDYLTKELKFEVNYTPEAGQDIVSFDDINSLWQQVKAA